MITLITGAPGSGKTALAVEYLMGVKDRPIFTMGIVDLKVPHEAVPPVVEWTEMRASPEDPNLKKACFTFPPRSLVVIDEAQTVFRPRAMGSKVPPEVAAFETHRHEGIDFILLTQQPGLVDANIRKLVSKHQHVHSTFLGRTLYEWVGLGDPESPSSRQIAAKSSYKPPKKTFTMYRSAEVHTKLKRKVPFFAWGAVVLVVGIIWGGWYAYGRIQSRLHPEASAVGSVAASPGGVTGAAKVKTKAEYVAERVPRVAGLYHTAPVYDGLTQPTDAPYPATCISVGEWRGRPGRCRCLDQQGNDYALPVQMCEHIVRHGMFKDWGSAKRDTPQAGPSRAPLGEKGRVTGGDAMDRQESS